MADDLDEKMNAIVMKAGTKFAVTMFRELQELSDEELSKFFNRIWKALRDILMSDAFSIIMRGISTPPPPTQKLVYVAPPPPLPEGEPDTASSEESFKCRQCETVVRSSDYGYKDYALFTALKRGMLCEVCARQMPDDEEES